MKKIWIGCITGFVICSMLIFPCSAEQERYSWYCKHVKEHLQPCADSDLAFVEEFGGYYIDHRHTDPNADDKVIYLTFDAGYENGNVAKILDVLKAEDVPGAFFILSNLLKQEPALVIRMAEEGHTVCNHTASHRDMSRADDAVLMVELQKLEALYKEVTGRELSKYYRPPEGRFSRKNLVFTEKNGYKTVFWSFAYPDWDNGKQMSEERAKSIILENVHNGEVMLLHPTSATNAAILQDVIRTLKSEGYRFGTLDELTGA